ncbi:hypothetical protein HOA91_00625 [Candidatus Woesearchaeota archaeon]|nr:hypothetical protein [Candidatus Woesearchaeota archaeon]
MEQNKINAFVGKHVRVYEVDRRTFWTGTILEVTENTTTIKDKFGRIVSVNNTEIKSISEWS